MPSSSSDWWWISYTWKLKYSTCWFLLDLQSSNCYFYPVILFCFLTDTEFLDSSLNLLFLQVSLLEEKIVPRTNLPPLLVHLRERHPEKLHYMGVSFGLTLDLFRFWRKHNFFPFYIGQIPVMILHLSFSTFLLSFCFSIDLFAFFCKIRALWPVSIHAC